MRGSTAVLAVIAVVAIGVLVFTWGGGDGADRSDSRLGAANSARPRDAGERLSSLRSAYDRREEGADREPLKKKAEVKRPEIPMRREMPTRGANVVTGVDADDLPYDEEDAAEVDELREVILNDPDPEERIGGLLMITGNEHPEAITTIVRAMRDPEAEVRLAAVEALGDYSDTLAPHTLEPALDDPDPEVRFEAVSIIGDMETDAAYDMVRRALDDPDEDVRELAEGILEDL